MNEALELMTCIVREELEDAFNEALKRILKRIELEAMRKLAQNHE